LKAPGWTVDKVLKPSGISIIIPITRIYSLSLLLNSIHADKTLINHEILLVGNHKLRGATTELKNEFSCIRFVEQNEKNVSLSRNLGLDQSKFKLVSFIDDDDIWLNNRTKIFVETLNHENNTIIFGSSFFINKEKKKIRVISNSGSIKISDFRNQFITPFYKRQKYFLQVGNCAFLKSEKVPAFRENLSYLEDQIWVYEALLAGVQVNQSIAITLHYNFSRKRAVERWSLQNEIILHQCLESFEVGLGDKYIMKTSLKSLAISGDKKAFLLATKSINSHFKVGSYAKLLQFVLFTVNKLSYLSKFE
jgi:hypothetical protein